MASVSRKFFRSTGFSIPDSEALVDVACVLVASASSSVRRQIADQLRVCGYSVVESRSGLEVLDQVGPRNSRAGQSIDQMIMEEVLKDGPRTPRLHEPIDLLVLDISEDPWSGLALLEAVRRQDWSLPVVLITGDTNDTIRSEARRLGVQQMFRRPVDPEQVVTAVRDIEPPMEELAWCA